MQPNPSAAPREVHNGRAGAGDGSLAREVLERFPRCSYRALERSTLMRERLGHILASFRERVEIREFELADGTWRTRRPSGLRCILASLIVHHLPARQNGRTFGRGVATSAGMR